MWQPVKILSVFNTLTSKQISWWTKTFLKKLEHRFFVESTKIENASFPHKTVISEANVGTNRVVSTKKKKKKNRSIASNYLIFFWKFRFSLNASFKELIWCTSYPNVHIGTFCILESFTYKIVHWAKHSISTISAEDKCNIK